MRIGDGDDVGSGGCGGGVGGGVDGRHRLRRAVELVVVGVQLDGGGRRKVVVELVQTDGAGRLQRLQLMQTVLRTAAVVGGHLHVAAVVGGYWHKNVLLIHWM